MAAHLRMGEDADHAIRVNSRHLSRGGRPWLPVSGEFHFSRCPAEHWPEELRKMRAGGITVVSTYVFWIMHEERRGRFRWDGDLDLRRFVVLCGELGLDVVARIGPWAHGEVRNGGFPDWWLAADCVPRTDDPRYLRLVRAFWQDEALLAQRHGELHATVVGQRLGRLVVVDEQVSALAVGPDRPAQRVAVGGVGRRVAGQPERHRRQVHADAPVGPNPAMSS